MSSVRAFKSLAEQTRLRKLVDEGTFPRQDFEAMLEQSRGLTLPERLTKTRGPAGPPKLSKGRSTRYDHLAPSDRKTHY